MVILYAKHIILACIITFFFLIMTAFLLFKTDFGAMGVSIMLVATYVLSNLVAGWHMGRCVEKKQFLWGMLVGLGYFFMVFLVSFIGNQFFLGDLSKTIFVFFLCVCSGLFGGMVS